MKQRAVVRRVLVDRVVGDDLEADLLGRGLDVRGQARAVDLLVVGHLDLRAAVLLHDRGQSGALDRVGGDDARVGALTRRVELVRLAGLRARGVGRQAHVGVRGADLRDAGLVQDRDGDGRGTRVELADVDGRAVVLSGLARVRGRRLRRPRARLSRRVVERLVLDGEVARLVAGLLESELDAVDHGGRLRARCTLERKRRIDLERLGLAALAAASAALIFVVAAGADAHRKRGDQAACRCQPACIQGTPPHKGFDLGGDSTHARSGSATE
jgi:hypothetical protein